MEKTYMLLKTSTLFFLSLFCFVCVKYEKNHSQRTITSKNDSPTVPHTQCGPSHKIKYHSIFPDLLVLSVLED